MDASRRPREPQGQRSGQEVAQHRRQGGPLSEGFGLRLHAGRDQRLVRRGRSRQIRRQRRHLRVDDAEPIRARAGQRNCRRLRRREDEHPREEEQGPRHPRRGARRDGLHAEDAGARRQAEGGHGPSQDPRQGVDRAGHVARPGRAAALPLAAVDGGDAEPGRHGGAVRAHLAEAGQEVRRQVPRRGGEGLGGGGGEPGDLRRARRRSAAGRTTTRKSATTSTGRRPSSTSRPRRTRTRRSSRNRRTTRRS